jgi:hypothetical protein
MCFSAGYSISLSPGILTIKYKDSLGTVKMLHIYCAKHLALSPIPLPCPAHCCPFNKTNVLGKDLVPVLVSFLLLLQNPQEKLT